MYRCDYSDGVTHPDASSLALARLAVHLRRLRRAAGLSQTGVATAIGKSRATLHRAEKAVARPHPTTLELLLDFYGASEAQRAELRALHDAARPVKTTP